LRAACYGCGLQAAAVLVVEVAEADGEEGVDGAVVGEAGLAALVPHLIHPLATPQDAVAPAVCFNPIIRDKLKKINYARLD
jgi:hypothetical protein